MIELHELELCDIKSLDINKLLKIRDESYAKLGIYNNVEKLILMIMRFFPRGCLWLMYRDLNIKFILGDNMYIAYGIDGPFLVIYEMLANGINCSVKNAIELKNALEKVLYYGLKNNKIFAADMIEETSYKIYKKALECNLLIEIERSLTDYGKILRKYNCNYNIYDISFVLTDEYVKKINKKYGSR